MNKLIQVVTLVNDPVVTTYGSDNNTMVKFRGAVRKRVKKEGENDNFFSYVAFKATADFIKNNFSKGKTMLITGELQNNNYTNKDGKMVYDNQILIESVEFFGKKADGDSAPKAEASVPTNAPDATPAPAPVSEAKGSEDSSSSFGDTSGYLDF